MDAHRSGGNPDFEIPGLERDAGAGWARFVTPPVFGVALSPLKVGVNYWVHAFGVRSILCDALYHSSVKIASF